MEQILGNTISSIHPVRGMPNIDLSSLGLNRTLSESELIQIVNWAESRLKDHPNEPMELLGGNTTILGIYIDGRKEQEEARALSPGCKEWEDYREGVRGYGKSFARKMSSYIQDSSFEGLTTLCYSGWGELVKNTFDHADGSSIGIAVSQRDGKSYFMYHDYLKEGSKGMIGRFRDATGVDIVNDTEIARLLFSPSVSTKSIPHVNCGLGIGLICSGLRASGTLDVSIHTDGYKLDIVSPRLDFNMTQSVLPSGIWYIATPKL